MINTKVLKEKPVKQNKQNPIKFVKINYLVLSGSDVYSLNKLNNNRKE